MRCDASVSSEAGRGEVATSGPDWILQDQSSPQAGWRRRKPERPLFQLTGQHEFASSGRLQIAMLEVAVGSCHLTSASTYEVECLFGRIKATLLLFCLNGH
jgi:hypothetical protein